MKYTGWLLAFGLAATAGAAPLRVAVVPAQRTLAGMDRIDDATRLNICLSLHLQERLARTPGVLVLSEPWSRAVFTELNSRKWSHPAADFHARFSAQAPVDAVIDVTLEPGQLVCRLYDGGRNPRLSLPCPSNTPALRLAPAVAEFLARELKLDAAAASVLCAPEAADPAVFDACYVSRRLGTTWIINQGESRLDLLRPHVGRLSKDALLAPAILDAALQLTADARVPQRPQPGIQLARLAVPKLLGTPWEEDVRSFLKVNKFLPALFEKDLVELGAPLLRDEMEASMSGMDAHPDSPGADASLAITGVTAELAAPPTRQQRLGALRCLGVLKSGAGDILLGKALARSDPQVREAAVWSLGTRTNQSDCAALAPLVKESDPQVAFLAGYALWRRDRVPASFVTLARQAAESQPVLAAEVLSALGETADIPRLMAWRFHADSAVRTAVVCGLLRLGVADSGSLLSALSDPGMDAETAALFHLPPQLDKTVLARLAMRANGVFGPIAEASRAALAPYRPAGAAAAARFDLQVEHPSIRLKRVESLATNTADWAVELLAEAATNADSHTRAMALTALAARDSARAVALVPAAIRDDDRWARLHAAAVAARVAVPAQAAALRAALDAEQDDATRLYLADAVARAANQPPPPAPAAVHRFDPAHNTAVNCGYGAFVESSPMQAYYCLDTRISDAAKRAYGQGKMFLCRANATTKNAGLIVTDSYERDRFWLGMESELDDLNWIDGVVIGEESMDCPPRSLWASGWRLFCRAAKLDPARVQGDFSKLTEIEARAYRHWERTTEVEGFNILYDYVKLRYGKLRPGFQVATFLPNERGPNPADRQWKFDIAGGYNYETSNRDMYSTIRRFKTVWPDRPVIWLSLGNGQIGLGGVKYNTGCPTNAISSRRQRAYADSVSVWLAGAETGWFNSWLFVGRNAKGGVSDAGVWVIAEDIDAASDETLRKGIAFAFAGVDAERRFAAKHGVRPDASDMSVVDKPAGDDFELVAPNAADDAVARGIREEQERLRQGYHLEAKFLFDCARVFGGLPRLAITNDVLLVGAGKGAAGFAPFPAYDCLDSVTELAKQDLARYRIIGIAGRGDEPLTDGAIAALTNWLKATPGLLYVHGMLSTDNSRKVSTPDDLDGRLQNDWPWKADVAADTGQWYRVKGPAIGMEGGPERPALVFWTQPGFTGGVVFDAGSVPAAKMVDAFNRLHAERGIGRRVESAPLFQAGAGQGMAAWVTAGGGAITQRVAGVDLWTGEPGPDVGPGRAAALVARDYTGAYAAAWNGVAVLCDQAIRTADAVPDGLRVECPGLIRAGSETGAVTVQRAGGGDLPPLSGAGNITAWILFGKEEGMASVPIGRDGNVATYVRCRGPVTIVQKR